MTLREKLESEANDLPSSVPCFDDASASSGATYMLDLLWPVIAAANEIADDKLTAAFKELEAKLEGKCRPRQSG